MEDLKLISKSNIEDIIEEETDCDYYSKNVRGIGSAAKEISKKTGLKKGKIENILDDELSGDYYSGNVRGIGGVAKRILKKLKKKIDKQQTELNQVDNEKDCK